MSILDKATKTADGWLEKLKSGSKDWQEQIQHLADAGEAEVRAMITKLENSPLKDKVNSWITKGEDLTVSADQLREALGDKLEAYAKKMGMTIDEAAEKLSKSLPEFVDKLTPEGKWPDSEALRKRLSDLKEKLKNL